jgi:hypothetical protein
MKIKSQGFLKFALLILIFAQLACAMSAIQPTSTPAPTNTPTLTATITPTPTNTPRPSPTPRPTKTPNLAATQRTEGFNAETQVYFDAGYIKTKTGKIMEFDDFSYDWAQLNWYNWLSLDESAAEFYITAHFKWSNAYRNANESGCGFLFAIQENGDHYAAFLDRAKIVFLDADHRANYSKYIRATNGTGRVKFDNPADHPIEADFTLIVKDTQAFVLVDGELVGTYLLSQYRNLDGEIGLSVLSGTNKDYGTRCEMTNLHVWTPNK